MTTEPVGRRERNKAEKRDRIFAAAADLFENRGFDCVTTAEIAAAADVGAGTLFRYAASKGELLLMVLNDRLREQPPIPTGLGIEDSVCLAIDPLLDVAIGHPQNFAAYQREVMFGPVGDHRTEALAGIIDLERRVGALLRSELDASPDLTDVEMGRLFLSMVYIELVRFGIGTENADAVRTGLRTRLTVVREGLRHLPPA